MNIHEFIAKWQKVDLSERSASQQHFLDLCDLFEHPKPAAADPTGESFTFERGAAKTGGGDGWADVWKKGFFGWEYKGKHKDLDAAYAQLLLYREALENPPLLVVCDMDRFIIHTNFTGTVKSIHEISLREMSQPRNIEILRDVFFAPDKLRPHRTSDSLTAAAAATFADLAQSLRNRGLPSAAVAHFVDRIVFCLFAEDVELLPSGLFTRLLKKVSEKPDTFSHLAGQLFDAMAHGGDFGLDEIRHFNGNLFADAEVLALLPHEIDLVKKAADYDWSDIDPSIFGTLFERGLDPDKRSQLGAHYTSRTDIETLVDPVIMAPLRREWLDVVTTVESLLATGRKRPSSTAPKALAPAARRKADREAAAIVRAFLERLSHVTILDPACGSGNFLYVSLQKLKDLEKEVLVFAANHNLGAFIPYVGPWQLYGIEINPYAFELAQMTVWIGHLQWIRANGYSNSSDPVLRPLDNFHNIDAILDLSDPANPTEPEWPRVDFIIGNPPFLGDKLMRRHLGDDYVIALRNFYSGRVPGGADLCCYWFEKARTQIAAGRCKRAGLLATQGIRGGANRKVLERIKDTGDIFLAESDRKWILNGANVHVSMVGFDNGTENKRMLDGIETPFIATNLASVAVRSLDLTNAKPLSSNQNLCYLGVMKAGKFDLIEATALEMMRSPNPNLLPNSRVLRPRMTARDILQRTGGSWIIDFGCETGETEGSRFDEPWRYLADHVKSVRASNRNSGLVEKWWIHARCRPGMRESLKGLDRFIVTPEVSKHRIFVWLDCAYLADHQTRVFARSDDYFFGVLHSRLHEVWARAQGTQLRERESGFRYTPTTCFETFPLPEPSPPHDPVIADAAKELDALRNRWLNPPEWTREEILEFPGSLSGPWARFVADPDARGIGTVRYPRIVPADAACAAKLKPRTLTNLYNERPAWLDLAHARLDAAVAAAYGWPADLSNDDILQRLLALNIDRASR